MASRPDEFDDANEEERVSPLLPREDRLWRHPSELAEQASFGIDPIAVRSRWLSNPPSRASAWTAGFVGALLATGLVVVGTHLAGVLATPPAGDRLVATETITTTAHPVASPNLGSVLAAAVSRVGRSIAVVDAATATGTSDGHCLGIVIGSDGLVLTAAIGVRNAASILVYLPGNQVASIGHVVGVDERSGLAVLRVDGASGLPVSQFATTAMVAPSFALAVTSPMSSTSSPSVALGALEQLNVAAPASSPLIDADTTDLEAVASPPGSPLLDTDGDVEAIVVGSSGDDAVVVPGWLALPVASELASNGSVRHGWLGIAGQDRAGGGVEVLGVDPGSAAARAGLKAGDVIVGMDGQRVTSLNQLQGRLYVEPAGSSVRLAYERSSARRSATVVLTAATG